MNISRIYHNLMEQVRSKDAQPDLKQLVSSLVEKVDSLESELASYKSLVKEQLDTIGLLNKKIFGYKSEKTHTESSETENIESVPSYIRTKPVDDAPVKNIRKKIKSSYRRPERRAYKEMEERIEVLTPDAEELKGAKFVRSEKTFRLYMIPARIVKVIYRKFVESESNNPEHSGEALDFIGKIYRLERFFRMKKFIPEKIREYRIRFTVPIFRKFKRLLRPTKLGLNNYLFFGNHKNAKRGAIIYTIVESCKLNNVNLFEYLKVVFSKKPEVGETYEMFLPNKWKV